MEVDTRAPGMSSWKDALTNLRDTPQQETQKIDLFPAVAAASDGRVMVGSCKSSKGVSVAVVDANAIIQGGEKLVHSADRFVSVSEVISEIRDPRSRHALNCLPFDVETLEPSPEALKKVIGFAKATGDLQTLSDVDLKLIALTYMFEAQLHGTQHLRDNPPPIQAVNVKRLPEKDLPGWGSNVPNIEEWEALELAADDISNHKSRILPTKDLSFGTQSADLQLPEDASKGDGSVSLAVNLLNVEDAPKKPNRPSPKKSEVKIDGKKMVAAGIDASQGQDVDGSDDWLPAVSRSTHRRFLRRKARREMSQAASDLGSQQETPDNMVKDDVDDSDCPGLLVAEAHDEDGDISCPLERMKLNDENLDYLDVPHEEIESNGVEAAGSVDNFPQDQVCVSEHELGSESCSQKFELTDDVSSEQSWTIRSLSDSSVACITSDFAMQNVILQMGLRLLAPGGMQIRELQRWVLKCHACFKVTTEIGRIFCPSCGNGGTLRKVAVTVNENGAVLASRQSRISLRGTKFSLPLPQGGRDAVNVNPILREDQLPQKFLYPKTKKNNKQEDDFFVIDDVFRHHGGKKSPNQRPVRRAVSIFNGRRNPNDNHFARKSDK